MRPRNIMGFPAYLKGVPYYTKVCFSSASLWSPACLPCACSRGNATSKIAPRGSLARTESCPPCASTMDRQIDSPMPIPPGLVVKKDWKMRSAVWGSTPGPKIAHRHEDVLGLLLAGGDQQLSWLTIVHRLDGVDGKIEDHLL